MAVTSETSQVQYAGNGVAVAFPTTFFFIANSNVVVKLQLSGGVEVVQTEGVHYTLTGAGNEAGGTVTMGTAPPAGATLTVERTVPLTQPIDFSNQGAFSPDTHEEALDYGTMVDQQLERRIAALEAQGNNVGDAVAGAGLAVSGTEWSVGSGDGLVVSADAVKVDYGSAGAMVAVTRAAASAGVSPKAARVDHKHDASTAVAGTALVGAAAAEGVATSLARSDHSHAFPSAAPVAVTKAAAAEGVAETFARSDHKHDVTTAAPSSVGTANTEGASTSLARADHVHNHGNQASGDGLQHAVAAAAYAGFMSAADKLSLDSFGTLFSKDVETVDATPWLATGITPLEGYTTFVEAVVVAAKQPGIDVGAGYRLMGTFRRPTAGATVQVGATTVVASHEDDAGLNAELVLSGNAVKVRVTGLADTTVKWQVVGHAFHLAP